ncbi:MAG: DUF2806 domain-containing protein [Bacilli bacterium]|nr:DUF2806 domain-containing protein [Bacilli bacterium]
MSTAVEIIKALVSPANKLIDSVTAAIGKAYQPRHVRKMAEAKAHEIELVSKAMRENADVPIVYAKGEISVSTTDFDEFVKRAQSRLAFQELQKQQNIESVADKAYEILTEVSECSSEPVSQDWITRFFNSVEDISNEFMQSIWANILAGEVIRPKTYSLRTLEILKNISQDEAELFERVAPLACTLHGDVFFTSNMEILNKFGVYYDDILILDECGLINSDGMISLNPEISSTDPIIIHNNTYLLKVRGAKEKNKISFGVFAFTKVGKELYSILHINSDDKYISDFADEVEKNNSGNVLITLHKINANNNDKIDYDESILKTIPVKQSV